MQIAGIGRPRDKVIIAVCGRGRGASMTEFGERTNALARELNVAALGKNMTV